MLTFTLLHDTPNFVMLTFAVFGLVQLIQKLPWPRAWMQRKPLGCVVCLSWWACIAGGLWNVVDTELSVTLLAFWSGVAGAAIGLETAASYFKPQPPLV